MNGVVLCECNFSRHLTVPFCAVTLLIYWTLMGENLNWRIPLLLASTGFTMIIGPVTVLVTYFLCHPSLRKPWWFIQYAIFSFFIYTDAKNICVRVSHLKQIMGESGWRITPRSAKDAVTAIEEKEVPDKIDIAPLGDATLTLVSLEQLNASGISIAKSNDMQQSREDFAEKLQKSRSSRDFVRSVGQFSTTSFPDMALGHASGGSRKKSSSRRSVRAPMNRDENHGLGEDSIGSWSFGRHQSS